MVLRAGFKKQLRLYVELKIYDKNRRKITGPQCVKCYIQVIVIVLFVLHGFANQSDGMLLPNHET
jgi:hypothetical protein